MNIKCPYSEFEIKIETISLNNKSDLMNSVLDDPDFEENFPKDIDKAKINKRAAALQGISVLELVNSPNYNILIEEYKNNEVVRLISYLENKGFTNKEAWAIILIGLRQ